MTKFICTQLNRCMKLRRCRSQDRIKRRRDQLQPEACYRLMRSRREDANVSTKEHYWPKVRHEKTLRLYRQNSQKFSILPIIFSRIIKSCFIMIPNLIGNIKRRGSVSMPSTWMKFYKVETDMDNCKTRPCKN